jgi:hypothetical protein
MSGGVSRFLFFDPTRTKPLEISPGYQDLVKDINPASLTVVELKPLNTRGRQIG